MSYKAPNHPNWTGLLTSPFEMFLFALWRSDSHGGEYSEVPKLCQCEIKNIEDLNKPADRASLYIYKQPQELYRKLLDHEQL